MAVENNRGAIEAILFANGASVEFSRIAQALEISEKKVKEHISALIDDYEASGRGITIILLDNSCQMVSKKEFAPQIRTVMDLRRNTPLSQAALEVLAVLRTISLLQRLLSSRCVVLILKRTAQLI